MPREVNVKLLKLIWNKGGHFWRSWPFLGFRMGTLQVKNGGRRRHFFHPMSRLTLLHGSLVLYEYRSHTSFFPLHCNVLFVSLSKVDPCGLTNQYSFSIWILLSVCVLFHKLREAVELWSIHWLNCEAFSRYGMWPVWMLQSLFYPHQEVLQQQLFYKFLHPIHFLTACKSQKDFSQSRTCMPVFAFHVVDSGWCHINSERICTTVKVVVKCVN